MLRDLDSHRTTSLFLGQYSKKGILFAFERLGLLQELTRIGLHRISIKIDTTDPFRHFLRIYHYDASESQLITEVVTRKGTFSLPKETKYKKAKSIYHILIIEWLLMQNPKGVFTKERPHLPNQEFPGLYISSAVLEIFYWMGRRMKSDGVLIVPNTLYTGMIYSKEFHFVDAKYEALMLRIKKNLLKKKNFAQVAWASEEGKVIYHHNNKQFTWKPKEMILPVSRAMNDYFFSRFYRTGVLRHFMKTKLYIEQGYRKQFDEEWKAIP